MGFIKTLFVFFIFIFILIICSKTIFCAGGGQWYYYTIVVASPLLGIAALQKNNEVYGCFTLK
jgi:hypothetical protein